MRVQLTVFLVFVAISVNADVFSTLTKEAQDVIHGATIKDKTIRQCTCKEQEACTDEITKQGLECVDSCWDKFNKITKHPEELRNCFHKADKTLGTLITCFEHNVESCLEKKEDKQIQKVDINKLFELGVEKITKTKEKLTKTLAAPIRKIIDTVGDFGVCVKDCFLEKNKGGFCFDKKDCQPLIVDKKAKSSLKICSKIIDFKKEGGEICECSAKAGVSELSQYCPMLKLLGSRRKGGNKTPN